MYKNPFFRKPTNKEWGRGKNCIFCKNIPDCIQNSIRKIFFILSNSDFSLSLVMAKKGVRKCACMSVCLFSTTTETSIRSDASNAFIGISIFPDRERKSVGGSERGLQDGLGEISILPLLCTLPLSAQ